MSEEEKVLKKQKQNKKAKKALKQLVLKLVIVAGVVIILLVFMFSVAPLHGNNMFPALRDGDLCINYKMSEIRLNDVVAYRYDDDVRYARVIGMPGDEIHIAEGVFTVNGLIPAESVFYETTSDMTLDVTVGTNEYFLMNDYRSDTEDSRSFGCVSEDDVLGKVSFLFRRRGF